MPLAEQYSLPDDLYPIAYRLAGEGVPIAAIARSLACPGVDVRESLRIAKDNGRILEMPRDDWPQTATREDRKAFDFVKHMDDEDLITVCCRHLKVTRLQSSILVALIRRNEATRELLHQVIETKRQASSKDKTEETDLKMVDVVVCLLRKRLKAFGIEIKTMWGRGYFLAPEVRKSVIEMVYRAVTETTAKAGG